MVFRSCTPTALNITQCSEVKLVQSSKMALNTCHDMKKQRCVKRTTRTRAKRLQAENTTAQIQGCKRDQPSNLTDIDEPQVKRQRIQIRPKKSRPSKLSSQPAKHIHNEHWLNVYEEGQMLGSGGFGRVFAGIRKEDGLPVAIKYVSKQMAYEKLHLAGYGWLPSEIALMILANTEPSCSNILKMLDWYEEPKRYIIVLERPEPCEDLSGFCLKQGDCMTEVEARKLMFQLMEALKHCKSRGILHRDVKPENILIQTDMLQVKLFDFGCADIIRDSYNDFAGTLQYAPPEWYLQEQYLADPTTVWSVGVTLYRLVCGCLPFQTTKDIINGNLYFPESLSQECIHLIGWCLKAKAEDRPSLEQIELHNWFHSTGVSSAKLPCRRLRYKYVCRYI
ncbi:serine/threonine-protein kinase pim-1-like [Tachysurus fulvidraco]|uniref:serine/threonine-protein kinase pim-1-like n=1 Tax=Tachysurus fulvidraco TaxID=1234273 RepID=UPI000F50F817|nr:serine/threonine-protein kinase pim-1-like [Tachysurus fulvidraco]